MDPHADPAGTLRRQAVVLLVAVAAAAATGRILSSVSAYDPNLFRLENPAPDDSRGPWPASRPGAWPTFGSNDRSRWDAVRALVDHGTWVIGRRDRDTVTASAPVALGATNPLDAVTLLAAARQARIASDTGIITEDGWRTVDKVLHPTTLEYYSTKPPLLTALMAGEYWLLKHGLGWSITEYPNCVVRTGVWTFNVPLLVVYLLLLSRLAERWGATEWGRLYVVVAACFGTLLTPFLNTFNNHTVATCSGLIALYAAVRILGDGADGWGWFVLAGLFAGFTACNELPATAYAVGLFLLLVLRRPARTLALFAPAALVPAAALLWTNYLELGRFQPAYSEVGGPWYQYEGSVWVVVPGALPHSIDFARHKGETHLAYAFHLLLGHHGWFSLTPVNLLALAGMALGVRRLVRHSGKDSPGLWAQLAAANLLLSAVVIGFYLFFDVRNYGGVSSGARWLMWLTPLWLLTLLPVADALGRRPGGRALAALLLALSVLSASYPSWNPWRHPWIYNWMDAWGRIPY
jgi:hypothetical protein